MRSSLLLNASYEPLTVVSARRAVTLILHGKAVIEDASPYSFPTSGDPIIVPYVARLTKQVHRRLDTKPARFSRRGVLVRDRHTCAYCGKYANTIDHVVPRALGGPSTYDNCVAACRDCNHKKGDKTLARLGWKLTYNNPKPLSPYHRILNRTTPNSEVYDLWIKYVSWYDKDIASFEAERLATQTN